MTPVTGFSAVLGQASPIRLLRRFVCSGAFPHALLFTGNTGIGKKTVARAFAMACNCLSLNTGKMQADAMLPDLAPLDPETPDPEMPDLETIDACGTCLSCRKILGGHHPDILFIGPRSSTVRPVIQIDQIRSLLQTLALKPHEARWRVVIFSDAQALNPEAGNALLKILEEPPDRTLLILTAVESTDLLPTLVSRCQEVRFAPLAEAAITRLLTTRDSVDPETAARMAPLCGGSYTQARDMLDSGWQGRREWIVRAMDRLTRDKKADIRAWLIFSEKLAARKEWIGELLDTLFLWLRDLMVVDIDPAGVLSRDYLSECRKSARHVAPHHRLRQIDAVLEAKAALRANTNARLTLDAMVLKMAGNENRNTLHE